MMVVAPDLSRFIRAKAYDRRTNRDAWPTREEFMALGEMTGNVVLATLAHPSLQEDRLHSLATKRTGKAGRPRSIDDELAERILAEVAHLFQRYDGSYQWCPSLRQLAKMFHISPAGIIRMLKRGSPSGPTWFDVFLARCTEHHTQKGSVFVPKW
jgi:hypothetical protein